MDDKYWVAKSEALQGRAEGDQLWELPAILRLELVSLRVDIKVKQSYLTSRPKEVQISHENHA